MATRKLQVEIIGDASSLQKALGNATDHSSRLGSALKTLGKVAAVGAGAAFAGLAVTVKNGFDEIAEGQKVAAQTAARLKSTGQAANVTAKDIDALAQAQSKLTGIDDEAVQAGENMLLTFTRIRNEAGKGNDIFNQTTVAVEDMATAMNDGAVPSAEQLSQTAIRVGKALNDPIKGMGALSRVGVQFDEDQKKLITTMVKSGDIMGAQKLILAELTREFGGSAKAAGDTLPGGLAKLRNAFDDVSAGLASVFLPALTAAFQGLAGFFADLSKAQGFRAKLQVVWDGIEDVAHSLWLSLTAAIGAIDWGAVGDMIASGIEQGLMAIGVSADSARGFVDGLRSAFDSVRAAAQQLFPIMASLAGIALDFTFSSWGQASFAAAAAFGVTFVAVTKLIEAFHALEAVNAGVMLTSLMNPATLAAAAVGALVFAFIQTRNNAAQATNALDRQTEAANNLTGAIRTLTQTQDAMRSASLGVKEAHLQVQQAIARRNQLEAEGKKGSLEYKDAVLQVQRAYLTYTEATHRLNAAQDDNSKAARGASETMQKLRTEAGNVTSKFNEVTSVFGNSKTASNVYAKSMDDIADKADKVAKNAHGVSPKIEANAKSFAASARAAADYARRTGEIPPALSSVVGPAGVAGSRVGTSFGSGVESGIGAYAGRVATAAANMVNQAEAAARRAADARSPSLLFAALGQDFMRGVSVGIRFETTNTAKTMTDSVQTVSDAAKTAIARAAALAANSAEIKAATRILGAGQVKSIIAGVWGEQPSLAQQLKQALGSAVREAASTAAQAVKDARAGFASAFGELASSALSAFDTVTSAWKPPAQRILDKLNLDEQKRQLSAAITQTAADLQTANQALAEALAGGDPDAIKTAQQQQLSAKQAYDAAVLNQTKFTLEQTAAAQQDAHDKSAARERIQLQNQLTQLQGYLSKHPEEYAKVQKKINALLAQHGVDQEFYGTAAGISFAAGLHKSENAIVTALVNILKKLRKQMPGSNAEEGPMSDLDQWMAGFGPTVAAGIKGDAIYSRIDGILETARRKSDEMMGVIGTAAPAAPIEAVATSQTDITTAVNTGLQERVKLETDDNTARVARQAAWDAQELVAVQTQMTLVLGAYRAGQNAILAMLDKYLKAYYDRGVQIGQRLADGLLDMRGAVRDAAQALADEITRALGVASQAAKSATDTTVNQLRGGRERLGGMAAGGIVTKPTLTWIGERGPEAVIPLSQMGGAGPTYVFQFPNYVGSHDDLIAEVRRGLYEVSRRNPGSIPGAA